MKRKAQPKPLWTRPDVLFLPGELPIQISQSGESASAPDRRKPTTRPVNGLYTVKQLAAEWGLSEDYVRALFRNEPGVMKLRTAKKGKRHYTTLRIPVEVAERVRRRMS